MKTPEEVAGKVPLSEDWEQSAFEIAEAIKERDAEHSAALAQSREECERLRAQLDRAVELLKRVAKYAREDKAVTPGYTRLMRACLSIDAFLAPSQPEPVKAPEGCGR